MENAQISFKLEKKWTELNEKFRSFTATILTDWFPAAFPGGPGGPRGPWSPSSPSSPSSPC